MLNSFSMQILTNLSCNLACDYCYEKKYNRINDADSAKQFMKYMFENNKEKETCEIDFIGGESFLCIDLLDELTEYAKTFGKLLTITISTNGTLIGSPEVRKYIAKNKDILYLGVSIDGDKELHDQHRKHKNGNGSYDGIIASLDFLFQTLGRNRIGVKATFTKDTFEKYYYQSILHLIGLGFKDISANIIYEQHVDLTFGLKAARVLIQVADYLLYSGLYKTVRVRQLYPDMDFIRGYNNRLFKLKSETRNYCGSSQEMSCLGFDNLIYGCNRFCTMGKAGMNIGEMQNGNIVITNQQLKDDVINQYQKRPDECRNCLLSMECPACVAIPYEQDFDQYIAGKQMCGWAYGASLARFYMCTKITKLEGINNVVKEAV